MQNDNIDLSNYTFNVGVAKKYGINAAVILQNIYFWILQNKANKTNFHDGRTWTYNSITAYTELFPFLTYAQIRGAIDLLVGKGVLVKGNYNKEKRDKTNWYAFADESKWLAVENIPSVPESRPSVMESRPLPDINTDSKPDIYKGFTSEYPQLFEKEEFVKQWERWKLYRREIKKTLTAETIKSQLKFLAEQNNPIATIEQAIRNGWQGLFPIQKGKETPKKFSDFSNIQGGFVIPE